MSLELVLVVPLVSVFVVSGVGKVLHPGEFRAALVQTYRIPEDASRAMAWLIPSWEIGTAGLLVIPSTRVLGGASAAVLIVAASILVLDALARGSRGDCGCFPGAREGISMRTLGRLLILAGVDAGLLLTIVVRDRGTTPEIGAALPAALILVGTTALVVVGLSIRPLLRARRRT